MIKIYIIASGVSYQKAASFAAATFALQSKHLAEITVLIPRGESISGILSVNAKTYGFRILFFPLKLVSKNKYVSQLKCQGFAYGISLLNSDDLVIFADADTFCNKLIIIDEEMRKDLLSGKVGLVPDKKDRHTNNPQKPWYLTPEKRAPYVNSGVIFASLQSKDVFDKFMELSKKPEFLIGPFNDQKVINFAFGEFFRDRLILLNQKYNSMKYLRDQEALICHCAGGVGKFGTLQGRSERHYTFCSRIIAVKTAQKAKSVTPSS
jgi:hypothetical protein